MAKPFHGRGADLIVLPQLVFKNTHLRLSLAGAALTVVPWQSGLVAPTELPLEISCSTQLLAQRWPQRYL